MSRKPLVVKVELKELCRDEWDQVMQVPENVLLAIGRFWTAWSAIPPLVRASAAFMVLDQVCARVATQPRYEQISQSYGLPRRLSVQRASAEAHEHIGRMLAALARHADDEAKRRGIDSDLMGT
jgi:hypothetical protein